MSTSAVLSETLRTLNRRSIRRSTLLLKRSWRSGKEGVGRQRGPLRLGTVVVTWTRMHPRGGGCAWGASAPPAHGDGYLGPST